MIVLAGVVACFALSGFAALLYQTAWLRQFTLVFGTSELAVATVLAAYMAGLAAGSALAARFVGRILRPVLVYGVLEAGIALSALAVPGLVDLAHAVYRAVLGGQPAPPEAAGLGAPVFYLCVTFLVLALPTGFMGATLPLLTRYAVARDRELGPRVALLYATNTAGAVVGTLVAGFALLPRLGLTRTVWVGVAVNALVFVIAAALSRWVPAREPGASIAAGRAVDFFGACMAPLLDRGRSWRERLSAAFRTQPGWILPLMLLSGLASFVYEVLWTRLLAHVFDGSLYAFATMLAAFLSGIAIGGGLAGRFAERGERAAIAFGVSQLAIAGLSVAVYAAIGALVPGAGSGAGLVLYAFAVMLPATLFIGATFPLAVRILARSEREAGAATARVYAWNTLGGIAGAVLAGFVLLPLLGFEGSVRLAVCLNLGLALLTFACAATPRRELVGGVALVLLAFVALYQPGRPQALIAHFAVLGHLSDPEELFYAVGRSATVLVLEDGDRMHLLANGLPEATIAIRGSAPTPDPDFWLTGLPVVARPDLQTLLVVGLGGGVALEGLPPSVHRVDVIELESEILRANQHLAPLRRRDPLADERIDVLINDARTALRMTDRRYDAIVSQPSHPWTAGASHLFTREFIESVGHHLEPGGVFVQWMAASFLTEPLLRSMAATLLAEFEQVRLYRTGNALFFLASDTDLAVEQELARTGRPLRGSETHFQEIGLGSLEELLVALTADTSGLVELARGAPVITDDRNLMATESRTPGRGLDVAGVSRIFANHDPLRDPRSFVHRELGSDALRFSYMARRALADGQIERVRGLAVAVENRATALVIATLLNQHTGARNRVARSARAAVAADPSNAEALYLLISSRISELVVDEPAAEITRLVARLSGAPLAVVRGSRHAARREWAELSQLDSELARSRVDELWYADALRLRATWRLRAARDRERLAREALPLLDAALVVQDHPVLQLLRLESADVAGEDAAAAASAFRVLEHYESLVATHSAGGRGLDRGAAAAMRRDLALVVRALGDAAAGPEGRRARRVLARVERLEGALAKTGPG